MKLSEDLKHWRVERPDEWKMDEFIRKAENIEKQNEDQRKQLSGLAEYNFSLVAQIKELEKQNEEYEQALNESLNSAMEYDAIIYRLKEQNDKLEEEIRLIKFLNEKCSCETK